MPTARPSISASVGVVEVRSTKPVTIGDAGHADADAEQRGQQRQPAATSEPKVMQEHQRGDQRSRSTSPMPAPPPASQGVAAELDGQAGVAAGDGRGEQRVPVGVGQGHRIRTRVGDLRVRDGAGLVDGAPQRVGDVGDLRGAPQRGDGPLDRGAVGGVGEPLPAPARRTPPAPGRRRHRPAGSAA